LQAPQPEQEENNLVRIAAASFLLPLLLSLHLAGCGDGSDGNGNAVSGPAEAYDACNLPPDAIDIHATEAGVEFVRTPDACYESLDGYEYPPNYAIIDGMRMHYVDAGPEDGEVVLMLHGQPSWSYLYRKMIPVLVDAGYRVIAADHIGMGRSDKPVDPRVHLYEQQVAWNKAFISELGLSNITLFVQDWGSLIGLRIAGDMPELFARIVLANGDLPVIPPGLNPFTVPVFEVDESLGSAEEFFSERSRDRVEGFQQWIDYAAGAPELFAGDVVQAGTVTERSPAEVEAYDAPYPALIYRAAIRAFPSMVAGIENQNKPAWDALGAFDRPFLALAGELDPNLGSKQTQNKWIRHVPGAMGQNHKRYHAAHFIQEDVAEEMAADVVDFMRINPIPVAGPIYNLRYCEILLFSLQGGELQAEVYNTLGLNQCPQAQWEAIDADMTAAEYDVLAAAKNGPRYWVLDLIRLFNTGVGGTQNPATAKIETFGELEMRLVAIVTLGSEISGEAEPYVINEVQRSTVFTYVKGRRIYELYDPDGGCYVMQSMSRIVDPDQKLSDLATLAERLELPPGWRFSTRILEESLQLTADGIAQVVVDDLTNTYQKAE
jgi:haloalkane dehalogenase